MPELPEVETVRRGLAPVFEQATIERLALNRPDLRFPFPPDLQERLEGATVTHVGRRAKYLLIATNRGDVVISHLGMSGSYRIEAQVGVTPGTFFHERNKSETHDHVIFQLAAANGTPAKIIYNDPRRFGFIDLARAGALEDNRFLSPLGLEPTGNALSGPALAGLLAHKNTPLKAALLDQRLIAGLGNIYVCEALWRAKLSPRRMARTIVKADGHPSKRCELLARSIRAVISEAIEAGGSSLKDYVHADGSMGYFQHSFSAYGQEGQPCGHELCHGTIARIVQSGRSTFFCTSCQR
ncbi:MAG: bifunctional DNA-formamidopyrimidine glycosylase/DNA-(apurinic or apyrimidinic site) lyase [Pseudomonadota bacterium]